MRIPTGRLRTSATLPNLKKRRKGEARRPSRKNLTDSLIFSKSAMIKRNLKTTWNI
jgi:hypothetical protein